MVGEFFLKLITRAKEVAEALKSKFKAVIIKLQPAVPVMKFPVCRISSDIGNAMKMSKLYKLTSDHAPVFSLFTFFPDRQ